MMTIKNFFKIFIILDILLLLFCFIYEDINWVINTQISFFSSIIITSLTFLSYKKNVLKGVKNQVVSNDTDVVDKIEDPYDLYSNPINEEVIENPTKEQLLEAAKPIKQNNFKNLKNSFFSFASFYRIGGYLFLILGFFYLANNHILIVYPYLIGFLVVPITVLIVSIYANLYRKIL